MQTQFISIIIPVLNEEAAIENLLQQLQALRQQGHEVIVVDGGSSDKTRLMAEPLADKVLTSSPGRAIQMNRGTEYVRHNIFWFLHADSIVPENAPALISVALKKKSWGRFNVRLSGAHIMFRLIAFMMNLRSCITGIATGDQGIFVQKAAFEKVAGFSPLPLMEDIDISKKLKQVSPPACIREKLVTSSRRWEKNGIIRTILLMWRLRLAFWLGVSAHKLVQQYR